MTTLDEKIAVMQAFADGAQIEYRRRDEHGQRDAWQALSDPVWNWCESEYRVKPREFFLVAHTNTVGWQVCEYEPTGQQGTTYIHVREVID